MWYWYWSKVNECPWCLKRPKLQTSVFGIRKGLLMEKAPTEKIGVLILLKWILRKYWVQASCSSVNGRENGRAYFCKTQALSRIPLMICLSEAGAVSLKALGCRQAWTLNMTESGRPEHFTLFQNQQTGKWMIYKDNVAK